MDRVAGREKGARGVAGPHAATAPAGGDASAPMTQTRRRASLVLYRGTFFDCQHDQLVIA
jgi:hypothetical protein